MQLFIKLALVCALAAPALASAGIKGGEAARGAEQEAPSKGAKWPALQQARLEFGAEEAQQAPEQREEQLRDDTPIRQQQQQPQQEEEAKAGRHEAKSQLQKGGGEQRREESAARSAPQLEQKREEPEQRRSEEEQLRELSEPVQQVAQAELIKEEQAPLSSSYEEGRVEQVQIQRQRAYQAKGAPPLVAPAGQAEPYAFQYQIDGSSRSESGDSNGVVRGQYTVQGADGSSRIVDYVADQNGFRASVNTNEFGTEAKSPAGVALKSSQPLAEELALRLEGKTQPKQEDSGVKGAPAKGQQQAPPPALHPLPVPVPAFEGPAASGKTGQRPPVRAEESASKGQRAAKEQQQQQQQREELLEAAPLKGAAAERAPKALSGEIKQAPQALNRAGFESATAHRGSRRAYAAAAAASIGPAQRPLAPAVLVRAQPPPVAVRAPAPAVSRAYLQRERYPPSPVQGLRHRATEQHYLQGAQNPKVSFYAPLSSFDDEQPAGFEQPDSS